MNYSLREYARNILRTLQEVCIAENLPQPNVISESGRALTAHHAVLIADVIDRDEVPVQTVETPAAGAPTVLQELYALLREIDVQGPIESLHDAAQFFADAQAHYAMGLLALTQRASDERADYAPRRSERGRAPCGERR